VTDPSTARTQTPGRREVVAGHRHVYRLYRVGDRAGKPTGSYTKQLLVGMKFDAAGRLTRDVRTLSAPTLAELADTEKELLLGLRGGSSLKRSRVFLVDYLREWLCHKVALSGLEATDFQPTVFRQIARERVAPQQLNTAIHYNGILERHVIPAVGQFPLADSDSYVPEIKRLISRLAETGKRRTAGMVREVLSSALTDATDENLLPRNVMEGVRRPAYDSQTQDQDPPTPDEVYALVSSAMTAADPLATLWLLMATSGCRPAELLGLSRDDVHVADPESAYVVLRRRLVATRGGMPYFAPMTKGKKARLEVVTIDSQSAVELAAHLQRQEREGTAMGERYVDYGLVFASPGGTPLVARTVVADYKKALKRAGLGDSRLYDLRHFHATTVMEETNNIKLVQRRLRHSSLRVLEKTYAHVRNRQDAAAAQAVGAAIWRRGDSSKNQVASTKRPSPEHSEEGLASGADGRNRTGGQLFTNWPGGVFSAPAVLRSLLVGFAALAPARTD
jgi:integrase